MVTDCARTGASTRLAVTNALVTGCPALDWTPTAIVVWKAATSVAYCEMADVRTSALRRMDACFASVRKAMRLAATLNRVEVYTGICVGIV